MLPICTLFRTFGGWGSATGLRRRGSATGLRRRDSATGPRRPGHGLHEGPAAWRASGYGDAAALKSSGTVAQIAPGTAPAHIVMPEAVGATAIVATSTRLLPDDAQGGGFILRATFASRRSHGGALSGTPSRAHARQSRSALASVRFHAIQSSRRDARNCAHGPPARPPSSAAGR